VTTEDQITAWFAKANPVPSLDLLDPIEQLDIDRLAYLSERSGVMSDLKTIEPTGRRERRPRWLVPALTAVAVALVAIPFLQSGQILGGSRSQAEEVAAAFMEAIGSYDGEAALELFASDGTHDDEPPPAIVGYSKLDRAVGLDRTNQGCTELTPVSFPDGSIATAVECVFMIQTDMGRALGLEPTTGSFSIYVEDGRILRTKEIWDNQTVVAQGLIPFRDWVQANHPDDYEIMFDFPDLPRTDASAIALFEQYADEFVAEMEG